MDLDAVQAERVNAVMKSWGEDDHLLDPAKLFLCERVVQTIEGNKVLLDSYNLDRILATIPFANTTYVTLCPACVKRIDISSFRKIVASGLVIPILIADYRHYPDRIVEFLLPANHVSSHEYHAYRFARIRETANRGLCAHCADERVDQIIASVKGKKGAKEFRETVAQLRNNIFPFVYPDYTLLDQAATACSNRDMAELDRLDRLGWSIYNIRSSQALNAPVTIDLQSLSAIPSGIATEADDALRSLSELQNMASHGLGLRLPQNVPLDRYLELVKDFQPTIAAAMEYSGASDGIRPVDLSKRIGNLNSEIERIRGLKRYVMLEASVTFVRQNKNLVFTSILAGTLGLAGGLLGCAGGVAAGAALKVAKQKGIKLPENKPADELRKMIVRDVRPYLSKLIAAYVGSNPTAVNVLSLRKNVEEAKAA
ncbi:hypothetical protein JQ625_25580 [Bradyrhizobium diazoefficiens]|nr:hypothetical protein [Bradyrhizobium diazoefficiens]MBR0778217.1 hypothetical protein [Bradyrhizobium diazoefficiens]